MEKLVNYIKGVRRWMIPILSALIGELVILLLMVQAAVHPWYRLHEFSGYRVLLQGFASLVLLMAGAVCVITLLLNSWPWVGKCILRRHAAQAVLGVGCLGVLGYAYSDLFWAALGDSLLLLENGRGIRVWLATYLLGLNFALVFFPYSIQFTKTGVARQRGYLEYLLCVDGYGRQKRVSLKEEVAYMHSQGDVREVFIRAVSAAPLTITQSLIALEGLVDPHEFFPLNRNYLVHWRAVARWEDEENGRRVKVWLRPPVYQPGREGEEEAVEYVSKEKAAQFRAWYADCLSRHEAT